MLTRPPKRDVAVPDVLKYHFDADLGDPCPRGLSGRQFYPTVMNLGFGFKFWLCHLLAVCFGKLPNLSQPLLAHL